MLQRRKIFLSNMFSLSCIRLIKLAFLNKREAELIRVALGEVYLKYDPTIISDKEVNKWFQELGFEVITNPDILLVEQTKVAAIELIFQSFNNNSIIRNSDYIKDKLQTPYDKISRVFSKITGVRLEQYIILLKIEKSKEMLMGTEYTVSEIAFMMGYSSVQYFSNQFKKMVGVTISKFKVSPNTYRKPLEDLLDR